MGNRNSRPQYSNPELDLLFTPIGCMGMTREEFDKPRLEMAPFLYYQFRSKTYESMYNRIIEIMATLPIYNEDQPNDPPMEAPPPPPGPNGESYGSMQRVFGPVYMFVAFDVEKAEIDCFLFFPSMTKQGKHIPNYHAMGLAHRWMHRLMTGPNYFIRRPQSSCNFRMDALLMGCRTDESYRCMQSKKRHKKMGLYRRKKNQDAYPAVYYRMYKINLNHGRVKPYVHPSSTDFLHRNILPGDMDMYVGCRYMLVSPNQKYFFIMGRSSLTLFRNLGNEDINALCARNRNPRFVVPVRRLYFRGYLNTYAIVQEGMLRVYSQYWEEDPEDVVFEIQAIQDGGQPPYALVLEDSGRLVMYDHRNEVVSSDVFDQPINRRGRAAFEDEYDAERDRRERMTQLVAYFKLIRLYREIPDLTQIVKTVEGAPRELLLANDQVGEYSSKEDYVARLARLLEFLIASKRMKADDLHAYGFKVEFGGGQDQPTPTVKSAVPNQVLNTKQSSSAKASQQPIAPTTEEEPEDPCDKIEDDEAREACITKREEQEAASENTADNAQHALEARVMSGEATLDDIKDHMSQTQQKESAARSGVPPTAQPSSQNPNVQDRKAPVPLTCPVPLNQPYSRKHDMYCRLRYLQEALRRLNRPVHVIETRVEKTMADAGLMISNESASEYNTNADRLQRLNIAKSALKP